LSISKMTDPLFEKQTVNFLAWFKSQPGTTFHDDIEIQDLRSRGAGRGIIATADIPADTTLFTIPRASIISRETSSLVKRLPEVFDPTTQAHAKDDEDHDMDDDSDSSSDDDGAHQQDSWTTLILILIHEHLQGPNSTWKPYLDVLPAGPSAFSTPMFWSADELAALQASPVAAKVGREEAEDMIRTKILPVIRAHEDVFFPPGPEQRLLSDDDLVQLGFRMGSVIMAYAFDLEKDDDENENEHGNDDEAAAAAAAEEDDGWVEDREGRTLLGMVPMADILNADASFNAHIEHGDDALAATALRPIRRGEEILNYYGPLSNGELLRRYGYVTAAHRRWDLVDLAWDRVLAALRAQLGFALASDDDWDGVLAQLGDDEALLVEEDAFVLERGAADPDAEGRVAEVTTTAAVPEDLLGQMKEVMKVVKKVRPAAVPDKVARDKAIYSALAAALDERARQYGTTLEQDESGMAAGGSLDRKMMALDVRIGEKVLLKEVQNAVRARLAELAAAARDGDGRSAKRRRI
ncbi:SET domain-containing protein, partial [Cryphonectria parasitica EP155]